MLLSKQKLMRSGDFVYAEHLRAIQDNQQTSKSMKLRRSKFVIFGSEVLSLRHKSWVGCQSLLSDRHQTDIIRLTLWQGANYTASVLT
ncbi:MAG: hypothetical protein U7127_22340 [Phormidium sp.]